MTAKQPAPVDVEKLKREVLEAAMDALNSETLDGKYGVGIEYAIDHLHERNLLNTAQEVEGINRMKLEAALFNYCMPSGVPIDYDLIIKAANAYLELTKGKG